MLKMRFPYRYILVTQERGHCKGVTVKEEIWQMLQLEMVFQEIGVVGPMKEMTLFELLEDKNRPQ